MAISVSLQKRIKAMADEFRREMFGPSGAPAWGTKFDELEDQACDVGDALTRALLEGSLEDQQAVVPAGPSACSVCGRDGAEDDLEPRLVTTRRGEVAWRERKHYCKHCRKVFFSANPRVGNSS